MQFLELVRNVQFDRVHFRPDRADFEFALPSPGPLGERELLGQVSLDFAADRLHVEFQR